jgi:hypothetical protein
VAGVVFGQYELGPQLLNDPVGEVVVLEEVDLLANFRFVEMAVE